MVLAWSRHLYAELVTDQSVPTWLGCHRRAFEFFGGVPSRLVIDNLKAAIARACYHDPGATCLRRVGRRLRGLLSSTPGTTAANERPHRSGGEIRQTPLRTAARLSRHGRRQRPVESLAVGPGRQPHPRHHAGAPADPVCRGRAVSAQAATTAPGGTGRVGQGQSPRRLPCAVRQVPLLGTLSARTPKAVVARRRDQRAGIPRPRAGRHPSAPIQTRLTLYPRRASATRGVGLQDAGSSVVPEAGAGGRSALLPPRRHPLRAPRPRQSQSRPGGRSPRQNLRSPTPGSGLCPSVGLRQRPVSYREDHPGEGGRSGALAHAQRPTPGRTLYRTGPVLPRHIPTVDHRNQLD